MWDTYPALRIGEFQLRYYSLLYGFSFLTGYFLIRWQVIRGGGSGDDANHVLYVSFLCVWLGGRLGHFIAYEPDVLLADPLVLIRLSRGGIASHGSIVLLFVGYWVYCRWRHVRFLDLLDRITFATAWGAFWIRIGNFFNSEIVGRVTDQTWGVRFPRYDKTLEAPLRHPAQLYEAALLAVILAFIVWLDRRVGKEDRPLGLIAGTTWFLYFGGRIFVESFKEFQTLDDGLTMGQWLSILPASLGVFWIVKAIRNREPVGWKTP